MTTVKAYINHGRWIADCPQCGGAEIVKIGQPFKCLSQTPAGFHGEATACGFTAEVEFPKDKLALERLLIQRPVANRNWTDTESIKDIQDENVARGLSG